MNIEKRTWMIKSNTGETQGPFQENVFQEKLRAGEIPFYYFLKSDQMDDWQPLLDVAFEQNSPVFSIDDRIGILLGSLLSGVFGYAVLRFASIKQKMATK